MTRCLLAAAVVVVVACGSKSAPPVQPQPPQQPTPSPELNDALAPVAWVLGDWHATQGTLRRHWVAAGGTLYAVAFDGPEWSVQIIDDGDGKADTADGKLRLIELFAGYVEIETPATEVGRERVRFGRDGITITLALDGGEMVETVEADAVTQLDRGGGKEIHGSELVGRDPRAARSGTGRYARATDASAPELEAADRGFDADTEAQKVAGWVKWFADDGVLWRGERIEGRDAIGAKMTPTLTTGHLRWQPIASRIAGDVGFTVGTATWTANEATEPDWRGSYVTIWRKQKDGRWLVEFDTGRGLQPAK